MTLEKRMGEDKVIELYKVESAWLHFLRLLFFVLYASIFQATIWGVFGFLIYKESAHPAWLFLALVVSVRQLGPNSFGIRPWGP